MTVSNSRLLLHQEIENLSENEIVMLLKMIKGLTSDYEIEEVPEDDPKLPRYMKILDEMDNGEYVIM